METLHMTTTKAANWRQTFFIIFSGQAFSLLSSAMVQFSLIWWLTDSTGSAVVLSIAATAGFLPQALLGISLSAKLHMK
jgi:DHA3 family macrolide efflux protein-like MFS transporter